MRIETTILGNLPVEVEFTVAPAEPDAGFISDYIDSYEILSIKTGKPLGDWAQQEVERTNGEDALICEMLSYASELDTLNA